MTIQAHAAAVLGLLQADAGPPQLVVLDGFVPTGTTAPYVVIYFSAMYPEPAVALDTSSLEADSDRLDLYAYCHSVGTNGVSARAVANRVSVALLDVAPTVSGRACWPIRHIENQPATRDETIGSLVMDQVDVYRLSSVPTS